MKNLIIQSLCLLLILTFCGNKAKNNELSENGTTEIIPSDYKALYLKYKEPINGYNVKVTFIFNRGSRYLTIGDYLVGTGHIQFEKGKNRFDICHPVFFLDTSFYNLDTLLHNAYNMFQDDEFFIEEYPYMIDYDNNNPPFFFQDVNFDGHKDLLLTCNWQSHQRDAAAYMVYLYCENNCEDDIPYQQTEKEPFNFGIFDEYTRFDYKKKEIILHSTGSAYSWTDEYYKRKGYDEFELYKMITLSREWDEEFNYLVTREYKAHKSGDTIQKVQIAEKKEIITDL